MRQQSECPDLRFPVDQHVEDGLEYIRCPRCKKPLCRLKRIPGMTVEFMCKTVGCNGYLLLVVEPIDIAHDRVLDLQSQIDTLRAMMQAQ